jgi:hypothetical protein
MCHKLPSGLAARGARLCPSTADVGASKYLIYHNKYLHAVYSIDAVRPAFCICATVTVRFASHPLSKVEARHEARLALLHQVGDGAGGPSFLKNDRAYEDLTLPDLRLRKKMGRASY